MILITGATGGLGKAVIDFLLQKGVPAASIVAFVRDEAKAASLQAQGVVIRTGDYNNEASMEAAFRGIDRLLLVSGADIPNRLAQHEAAVRAARTAGVKHLLYTSFARKNDTETNPLGILATSHVRTEQAIEASGIPFTFFRNNLYAEVIPMFLGENVFQTGVFLPAGEGRTAFATRTDMAEAIAAVLAGEGHENKAYALSSPTHYTFQDIAGILSEIAGKPLPYTSPTPEVFTAALTQAGVPAEYIWISASFAEAIRQGEQEVSHSDLETLLGHAATPLAAFLKQVYGG